MEPISVAVVDEHDIFRRGLVACLREQPGVAVVADAARGPVADGVDVAVVSLDRALEERFACPLLVCVAHVGASAAAREGNHVMGELPIASLTPEVLAGAARAAAAGLEVHLANGRPRDLDGRSIDVLRLLAEGADTERIAAQLTCSPRTVKSLVAGVKRALHARSRSEAVAKAIRRGLI